MENTIKNYISKRYDRWLDYSTYHCTIQNMTDEAVDVLNEVLECVLNKGWEFIENLYLKKKGQYRELDYYILRLILVNTSSATAPYRWRYHKRLPIDGNITDVNMISSLDIVDEEYDITGEVLRSIDTISWIFERLNLNDLERDAFKWRFFDNKRLTDWPGDKHRNTQYFACKP